MRAIPFRLVCILGMNDGDYPRSHQAQSFDLMNQRGHYRPGDRSRRQDDQYLFLEALLSAREQLYISWIGRSIRDNSARPPSVLVSQLRDFIARAWQSSEQGEQYLASLTTQHPLQPFSQDYIKSDRDHRLFTYSREWFETDLSQRSLDTVTRQCIELPESLALEALGRFLKEPVKTFAQSTLTCYFEDDYFASEDNECFELNHLESYIQSHALLAAIKQQPEIAAETILQQHYQSQVAKGLLPLAGFSEPVFKVLADGVARAWQRYQDLVKAWPCPVAPHSIDLAVNSGHFSVKLIGELSELRANAAGEKVMITVIPQALIKDKKISYHRLMTDWVKHLAACAEGIGVKSLIVSADGMLEIQSLAVEDAEHCLRNILNAWYEGLNAPLPVEIKTAFVWLAEGKESLVRKQYAGSDSASGWSKGVVEYDAYLRRFFPDFDALNPGYADDKSSFDYWALQLYQAPFQYITRVFGAYS